MMPKTPTAKRVSNKITAPFLNKSSFMPIENFLLNINKELGFKVVFTKAVRIFFGASNFRQTIFSYVGVLHENSRIQLVGAGQRGAEVDIGQLEIV